MSLVSMTWPEYLAGCCRIDGHLTRLTFLEADALVVLLLSNPDWPAPMSALVERVWTNPDREPPTDPSNVLVAIFGDLRRRGIKIVSRRQFGYCIPREARGRQEKVRLAA